MAIGAVSFRGEDQQKKSSVVPGAVAGTVIGAGAGYVIGAPQDAKHILSADKFEFSDKDKEKYKTDPEKEAMKEITEAKAANADAEVTKEVNKKLAEVGIGEKETEGDVKKFLKGDAPTDLAKAVTDGNTEIGTLKTAKDTAETAHKPFADALSTAKTAKETAEKGTDEAAKTTAKEAFEKAEKEAKKTADELATATKNLSDKTDLIKKYELLNANGGKLPKAALETHFKAEVVAENGKKITSALEKIKLPKIHPTGKIALFAGIGLVAGAIISKLMAPKAEAPAEEAKA